MSRLTVTAMTRPPLAIGLVLVLFTLIIVGCLVAITVAKSRRERRERLDAPVRARLARLPAAVALDDEPPAAPPGRRERRVAFELVLEATFALEGPSRARAVAWFERNGYVDELVERLRRATRRSVRPGCALQLGRMGSPLAAPVLADGLFDGDYRVRDACATALGRVAPKEYVEDLVDALARRDVPRGVLSNALLQLRDDADPALIACLENPDAEVRSLIAQVLGLRRTTSAADRLTRLLHDAEPAVRREAVLALAHIASNDAVDVDPRPLFDLSDDPSPIVRSAVATSLGTILGDRAATVLRQLCHDDDYWVSHRAAESLCRLPSGVRFGWEVLAAHDPSPSGRRARTACLEWMERTGGLERRIEEIMRGGDDTELIVTLAVLEEVGSRAWGDLFATLPTGAGMPGDRPGVPA